VVFLNPIKEDVDTLINIMQRFGEATELRININKSTVAPIRCVGIDLQPLSAKLQWGTGIIPH
jgi:hypothetical protein